LIIRHCDAVLAIANALMVHRTLDAVMIHKIIARAPERARRVDWARIERNAAEFAARGKLMSEPETSGIGVKADMAFSGGYFSV
jgi:hypothetical protein